MKSVNVVCTSKPGDGLLRYSYEHSSYLRSLGLPSKLTIITHPGFKDLDYVNCIREQYIHCDHVYFNEVDLDPNSVTLIMGRSMLTIPYLKIMEDKKLNRNFPNYTKQQLYVLSLVFGNNLISVYSENHPKDYPLALNYFNPRKVVDLCDYDVYPNGVGIQFEKIINFDIYKSFKHDIKYQYLFLGTNKEYYKTIEDFMSNNYLLYQSHGIVTYTKEKYINPKFNNLNVPVANLLGSFETYCYIKSTFDPAPRLMQECRYFGKKVLYLRDPNIVDGGSVYWKRPVPTRASYFKNFEVLLDVLENEYKFIL